MRMNRARYASNCDLNQSNQLFPWYTYRGLYLYNL